MYSDIRFALRIWRRRPVLSAAAILTLALGTGANTAIFSVIYGVMLKPLPYPEPARLVQIWSADRDPLAVIGRSDPNKQLTAAPVIEQWRKLDTPFTEIGYHRPWQYTVGGEPGKQAEPERVTAGAVSAGFFTVLGLAPARGRRFTERVAMPRFHTTLLGGFALLALLLAAVGTYGVIAYAVSLRTREIGIRMAIGAQPRDVLALMLRAGFLPPLAGAAAGIPLALAGTRALAGFLYGVQPIDGASYASVTAVLLLVAVAAAWFPARRAMKVDPMAALRHE